MADWADEEPGFDGAMRELERLGRRMLRRRVVTLTITLALAGAVVAMRAKQERVFSSRVVFRVVEGDLDKSTAPAPAHELRNYVADAVFSNTRLLEVMKTYGLFERERKRDVNLAIESMREAIAVEVWRNYFIRGWGDEERTARLSIEFQDKDPQRALVVTRALGTLLEEVESASRSEQAEAAVRGVEQAEADARELLARRRGERILKEMAMRRARPPEDAILRSQVLALAHTIDTLEHDLRDLGQKRNAFALRAAAERSRLGLRFEQVEPGHVARPRITRPQELAMIGLIAFLVLLPLCGIGVGAFDGRVYGREDAARLGWRVLAHVGAFPGDNEGALDERLRREHNQRSS